MRADICINGILPVMVARVYVSFISLLFNVAYAVSRDMSLCAGELFWYEPLARSVQAQHNRAELRLRLSSSNGSEANAKCGVPTISSGSVSDGNSVRPHIDLFRNIVSSVCTLSHRLVAPSLHTISYTSLSKWMHIINNKYTHYWHQRIYLLSFVPMLSYKYHKLLTVHAG